MKKCAVWVGLVAALAMVTGAFAGQRGEKKARGKAERGTGQFVSATLADDTIQLKLTMEDGGEKTFEMPADILVTYGERKGNVVARMIRAKGKKPPKARGKMKIFDGKFVSAAAADRGITLKVNGADVPAEGEEAAAAAERDFTFPAKMTVMYRDAAGALKARAITGARTPRKPKGERPDRPKRRKKNEGGEGGAPDNI